jgi:hypothetical protein
MTVENEQTPAAPTPEQVAAAEAAEVKAPLDLGGDPAAPTPKVAEKAAPTPEAKGEPEVVQYNPTGDVGLDMTLEFLGKLGYTPDNPAMKAAINGDFTLLAAELAAKDVKGYDRYIALGEKAYKDTTASTAARQAADRKIVEDAVGGAAEWATIQKWAVEKADPDEKAAVSAALRAGGVQARMAAVFLRDSYSRATGAAETEGAGAAVAATKGAASSATDTLNASAYAKAVAAARVGYKGDFEASKEYRELQARRLAHRG